MQILWSHMDIHQVNKTMKNKKIGVMQMIVVLICAGCTARPIATRPIVSPVFVPTPTQDYSSGIRDLQENQAKWESQHITHYQMVVDGDQEFLPLLVEVKDGTVVSAVNAQGEKLSSDSDEMRYYPHYFSIPALFSFLSQMYAETPPSIGVDYDPTFGYPVGIGIDPFTEPCCQDFSISIQDFRVLSP
jgi:hypothetical protein